MSTIILTPMLAVCHNDRVGDATTPEPCAPVTIGSGAVSSSWMVATSLTSNSGASPVTDANSAASIMISMPAGTVVEVMTVRFRSVPSETSANTNSPFGVTTQDSDSDFRVAGEESP